MNPPGDAELLITARAALLDALEALAEQREALVLIGAQAIYLQTGAAPVALAETTKDSDLAVDPRMLSDSPLLDMAMKQAGFHLDIEHPQPGGWLSPDDTQVDLMVPKALAGKSGRRGARIPPHSRHATRRTAGLEAAVVDHAPKTISALDPDDSRGVEIKVAGPAALLVAKLHKLGERQDQPDRLIDKDAHDIYRLLVATDTQQLATTLRKLQADELAGDATTQAIAYLEALFAPGPNALGSMMAGRAEQLVGDPEVASAAVAALATDLLSALETMA
ncbi:MAG: hypothetical protein ACRDK7_13635 [Solirubrobacteraceae bacterium]